MTSRMDTHPPWRQVLVLTDLSMPGIHAAWRAARIAREQGAALQLAAWAPAGTAAGSVDMAVWQRGTRRALRQLAQDIGQALRLPVSLAPGRPGDKAAWLAAARASELVVMAPGAMQRPAWRPWVRDTASEVLLVARAPVLLVRRPAGLQYRQTIAAISGTEAAVQLLTHARQVAPRAAVEVVQVQPLGGRTRVSDLGLESLAQARRMTQAEAQRMLESSAQQAGLRRSRVQVAQGSPSRHLLDRLRKSGASLLVMGPGRMGLASRLPGLGTMRRQLWAHWDGDLLCMPPEIQARSAPAARQRLRTEMKQAGAGSRLGMAKA